MTSLRIRASRTFVKLNRSKGDSTNVTWSVYSPSAYMAKVIGVFASMDKMIGEEFETGLANMKAVAER
jgi:hypothetical protein